MAKSNDCPNPCGLVDTTGWVAQTGSTAITPQRLTGLSTSSWDRSTAIRGVSSAAGILQIGAAPSPAGGPDLSGVTVSGTVLASVSVAATVRAEFIAYDSAGATIATFGATTAVSRTAGQIARYQPIGAAPSGTRRVRVRVITTASVASGAVITAASVRTAVVNDATLPFLDGASQGWAWSGTAGSSVSGLVETWKANLAAADSNAAGFLNASYNRQTAAGDDGASGLAWPVPVIAAPGDRGGNAIRLALPASSKRYELEPAHGQLTVGDTYWFAQAFYLDSGFPLDGSSYQVIEQMRQSSTQGSPPLAFEVRSNGQLLLTGGYGIDGTTPARLNYTQVLATGIVTGRWYNLVYRVSNFSTAESTTTIDVYLDGVQVLTGYVIPPPTVIGGPTYRKQGLYHDPSRAAASIVQAGQAFGTSYAAVDPAPASAAKSVADTATLTDTAVARPVRLLSTRTATFDTDPTADFPVSYGATIVGGRLRIQAANAGDGSTTYAGRKTADQPNGTDTFDSLTFEVTAVPGPGNPTSDNAPAMVWIWSASQPAHTRLGFQYYPGTGQLEFESQVNYADGPAPGVTLDLAVQHWWRVRRDGAQVVWETSPNRADGSWTEQRRSTAPTWLLRDDISASWEAFRKTGATDYFEVDNINVAAAAVAVPTADAATLTDAAAVALSSTVVDAGTLTDTAALTTAATLPVSDTAVLADQAATTAAAAAADTANLADVAAVARSSSTTDAAALADAAQVSAAAAASDGASLTEARAVAAQLQQPDAALLADAAAVAAGPAVTDTAALGELGTLAATQSATDAATLVEQPAAVSAAAASSDTATLADTPTVAAGLAVADTAALVDVAGVSQSIASSDAAALADTAAAAAAVVATDAATLAELVALQRGSTVADAGALGDQAAVSTATSGTDTATLVEAVTVGRTVTDTGTLTDVATVAAGSLIGSDSATATDTAVVTAIAAASDTATLTDVAAGTAAVARVDVATLTDTAVVATSPAVADSATLGEQVAVARASSVTDSATLLEAATAPGTTTVGDTATVADVGRVAAAATGTDSATLGEQRTVAAALDRSDSATLGELGSVSNNVATSDSATLGEQLRIGKGAADSATLAEQVSIAVVVVRGDAFLLSDTGVVSVGPTVADSATLVEALAVTRRAVVYPVQTVPEVDARAGGRAPVLDPPSVLTRPRTDPRPHAGRVRPTTS